MNKRHHIPLIAGLGSSVCPSRYAKWAQQLKKRLLRSSIVPAGVNITISSSDKNGEKAAIDAIMADHQAGRLGKVIPIGHSNGAAEVLVLSRLCWPEIEIAYLAVIDMTLGHRMWRAEAYGSIVHFDEFWAGLAKSEINESFVKMKRQHNFFDLDQLAKRNVGHVEAASLPIVQDRIVKMIEKVF